MQTARVSSRNAGGLLSTATTELYLKKYATIALITMNVIADHLVISPSRSSIPGFPWKADSDLPPIVPVRPSLFVACDITIPISATALIICSMTKNSFMVLFHLFAPGRTRRPGLYSQFILSDRGVPVKSPRCLTRDRTEMGSLHQLRIAP